MERLFASSFQCIYHSEETGHHAGDGFLLAEKRALWWDPGDDRRRLKQGSFVELSGRFFREATGAPVPLDLRVLRALRSPFEIDIYVWLTWRLFRLRRSVRIPWSSLMLQFGCSYQSPRLFKYRFLQYVAKVLAYYPEARVTETSRCLWLRPSPPHVSARSSS